MSSSNTAINILLFCLADSDAEQLVTHCRRGGRIAHTFGIDTGEKLAAAICDSDWDVLIFDAEQSQLDIQRCCHILRKYHKDIPVIYVGEGDALQPPDPDVVDMINKYNMAQIVNAAFKAQSALGVRRELATTKTALSEAEERNQLLLNDHQDPIAYITDGMVIYANTPFCEQMGYDDLDGFPIVDLITNKDQERFKNVLKKQRQHNEHQQFEISFFLSNRSEFKTHIVCDSAHYEGEDCIQISIVKPSDKDKSNGVDNTTRMSSKHQFLTLLQEFIENERNSDSSLILMSVDHFSKLRHSTSLIDVELLIEALSNRVRTNLPAQHYGRVADDMIAAIAHHVSSDTALEMAMELVKAIESEIFEVRKQSLQCTASIAVMPINHLTPPKASLLLDTAFDGAEKIYHAGGNNAEICRRDRQQLDRNTAPDDVITESMNNNRLSLLFQPLVNLGASSGDHYEATLNINDWVEGEITAGEMLRAIEREPENTQLDHWIVVEATKQLAKERLAGQDLKLIINLSGNVFHDPEFCSWLSVAFKAAGLPPSSVILQFSEESIADALKPALDFATHLQKLGSSLAVRNFGRAQKGNKFLSHIRPALVKPGYRAADMPTDEQIRDMVQHAKTLNSQIVIPNVSSAATLAMLWQLGPDFIQGSYVNEPMPSMNYEFAAFG
ncbi:EAL domain-containing protein [uncultured Zhongshania sp.]|uniref:sensor domain-containing phosphodiesterase n=1 Tax=uncultured Zhongshania sp. TaxID=1642288 RepID=UPI0030DC1C76|tara:strand:+ start:842 stop:2851 length:2010 start_codon:yes stop_codon:yes gene_type:complete